MDGATTMKPATMCPCGCGRAIEEPRPNRKFFSPACRVRYYRRYGGKETVTSRTPSSQPARGAVTPTVTLSAFDLKQIEKIDAGEQVCCTWHLATATSWHHEFPNPYREASYLSDLKNRNYCGKNGKELSQ